MNFEKQHAMAPKYHENFMGDTVFNFACLKEKTKNDLILDLEKMLSKVKIFVKYRRIKQLNHYLLVFERNLYLLN